MESVLETEEGRKTKRRWCSCSKDDFLPEESFQSWASYRKALGETGLRLKDRITARSVDKFEITEIKARSGNEMKKSLSWWDLIWFGIGAVIGSGIFVLTGQEARDAAGPAVILSYVVSGVSAMLSVFCYTEFAIEIPVAGGSFAYLRVELGDFVAFVTAGNIILEYVIGGAAVARSWTSYFATLLNHHPNDFRIHATGLAADYSQLDPIAVVVITLICIAAVMSTKASSRFNYVASIAHLVIILFIIVAGLIQADTKNLTADFAPFGARGIFAAASVLFFAYIGFDAVSTMAEETKNPAKDIPLGLVGSMVIVTLCYCLMAVALCLMVPYYQIDPDAPFSVAFSAIGMDWAKYIVAFGALKGMTTVLLVSAVGQARYLTHIARTHMVPPWLAQVHGATGTPINATVVMLVATAVIAFFTSLGILANLLSISTLFIFMLVAVALLVRRYYVAGETTEANRKKLVASIAAILAASLAMALLWATVVEWWLWYVVALVVWLAATGYLWWAVPQARTPEKWGVPLVPWIPSASIAINIFLLGSIDGPSYVRFSIWTLLLLVYYFFFGLHASYDTAKSSAAAATAAATARSAAPTAPKATPAARRPVLGWRRPCGPGGATFHVTFCASGSASSSGRARKKAIMAGDAGPGSFWFARPCSDRRTS
ncbi:cationic amino acid transporter 1-like isoform X3 [Curcuma longa]|uniref:cationic amino acid transporter 1-like isoform X3 n=1 Tax=Curcuma longa TaxID=136217 RepID=UPI003D9DBB94